MVHKLSIYQTLNSPTTPPTVQKHERDVYLYSIRMFVVFAHKAIVQAKTSKA